MALEAVRSVATNCHKRGRVNQIASLALAATFLFAPVASAQSTAAEPSTAALSRVGKWDVSAEALFWTFKDSPTPVPIVTDGVLGAPDTKVLLGGGDMGTGTNDGFRLKAGYTVNAQWGVEGSLFYFPTRSSTRSVSSSGQLGSTDLLLPFYDVTTNSENVTELSFSPSYAGSVEEKLSSNLRGGEINARWTLSPQVDLIGGLRYLRLRETYSISTSSPYIAPQPVDIWMTNDTFGTTNSFYGVQIGARGKFDRDQWIFRGAAKLAIGTMKESVGISGDLTTNDYTNYGATQTFAGGYFALPSNIGNYSRNTFAVIPEGELTVGYRLTPALSLFVGYTALYVSNVVRPGQQISRNINPTQSVSYGNDPPVTPTGASQPTFQFNTTDFWAQGVSVGLALSF